MRWLITTVITILSTLAVTAAPLHAQSSNVNNFTISTYDIAYDLSQDDDGRSTLRTVETITAEFPDVDQNHGIERVIPTQYDGHSTGLRIISVTDGDGTSREFSARTSNQNQILRIGNPDAYAHGTQTYVITYEQRDVTRYFEDTNRDEWYWDTNGTQWSVPISQLTVTLSVDDSIASHIEGAPQCYSGRSGQDTPCTATFNENQITTSVSGMSSGENITLALGFSPNTFAAYEPTLLEKLLLPLIIIWAAIGVIGIIVGIWLCVRWYRWSNRTKDIGSISPEYIPPKDASVTLSAQLLGRSMLAFSAQLVDLAVRRYIRIIETKPKKTFTPAEFDIEILRDTSDLSAEEQEVLRDIFNADPAIGQTLSLKSLQNNYAVYYRMNDNDKKLQDLVRGTYGIREKDVEKQKAYRTWAILYLVIGIITLHIVLVIFALALFILAATLWPLTDKGVALKRYLLGLKLYISVAETERLKMLQSPEGAEKVGVIHEGEDAKIVKLYERVLPYAMLFGLEKGWNAQLGRYYESMQASPDWYQSTSGVFHAAAFGTAMSSFSTSASYASPSSSSSGGSSGGGFSGGGGGGGGGGGW